MSKISINTEVDYAGGSKRWEKEEKAELKHKYVVGFCESCLFVLKRLGYLSSWVEVIKVSFYQPERCSTLTAEVTVILADPLNREEGKIKAVTEFSDIEYPVDAQPTANEVVKKVRKKFSSSLLRAEMTIEAIRKQFPKE